MLFFSGYIEYLLCTKNCTKLLDIRIQLLHKDKRSWNVSFKRISLGIKILKLVLGRTEKLLTE